MRRFWLTLIVLLVTSACQAQDKCQWPPSFSAQKQVLFLGNSYTNVNDLPGTFSKLACSGGKKTEIGEHTEGGWTLANHVTSQQSLDLINKQKWDIVVLQEQSEVPTIESLRIQMMYPAARTLAALIKKNGAQPMFYLTFGHRYGFPASGMVGYEEMQNQLNIGYTGIALELGAPVAPVGKAWAAARLQKDPLDLWQNDGSHPNEMGTYLAACVFFETIFHQTPVGLPFWGNLSQETALRLQKIAESVLVIKAQ